MYTIAVERDFIAQHFLFGGVWGAENSPHAHHYVVEIRLKGMDLNQHGFLTDIVDIESILDGLVSQYRNKLLNALPEFSGINPSIEHFARILCEDFVSRLKESRLSAVEVRVWENRIAWASYIREL
ncbi:MAG: 6-carboxytetrahydropterin synthase [Syntrophales bacterium LBB04]|nr:6-carboxytetrahydropterin synthase [Syntrophales bacterium LBB04]